MQSNVGTLDRVVRIAAGIALLAYAFTGAEGIRWLGLIGLVPIVTALASYCPLYSLLGIATCRKP